MREKPYVVCRGRIQRHWELGALSTEVARDLLASLAPYIEEASDRFMHPSNTKTCLNHPEDVIR